MNFAPYQDASPESTRAMSPPLRSPTRSPFPRPSSRTAARPAGAIGTSALQSPRTGMPPVQHGRNGSASYFPNVRSGGDLESGVGAGAAAGAGWGEGDGGRSGWSESGGFGGGGERLRGSRGEELDLFETRLGIRMDYEACLAYLLLPPAGGVLLLVLEHRSDYVRFHAWQSSLLFSFMFVIHVIFSWTSILSWMLFAFDLIMIAFLTLRAYRDAETLDRCEVPFFGPLASSILDDE